MKKIISILVSVIMILTALPVFADGETTVIPASVDIYEALDNFSADELATTYTSSAPYTTASGFKAPISSKMSTTLCEDDERVYVRTKMNEETNPNAGINIFNEDIKFGSDAQYDDTISYEVTFRTNNICSKLYWYFLNSSGSRIGTYYPLRIYGAGGNTLYTYANGYISGNDAFDLANNVWYTLKFSVDLSAKTFTIFVNGGEYENYLWTATLNDTFISTIASNEPISGIGFGFLSTVSADTYIDIDSIGLSNSPVYYDDKLTFDEKSLMTAIESQTAWSMENWSASQDVLTVGTTLVNVGGEHGNVMKYNRDGGNFTVPYTFDEAVANSEGNSFIVELSYNSHSNGQPRMCMHGTNTSGTSVRWYKLIDHPTTSGSTANLFGSSGLTGTTPIDDQWHRVRLEFDMEKDVITFSRWEENEPQNVEKVVDSTGQLATFSSISSIVFYPYQRTWSQDRYMYLDDFRVYEKDTLRYIGANPANGEGYSVSEKINPSILFNMPIASSTATTENVYLLDSDGNKVAGTVGLNYQRNGVAFYPAEDLEADAAYTFVANCEVTDEFGSSLAVNKTIKFETSPTLNLVDFKFIQNDVEAEAVAAGDLVAEIQLKSRANELRDIYAAIAIYNKVTNELVSIDTDSINAVTKTFELTANVPDDGNAYYAKAFVWNTDTTAAPYFAAETLGLND